MLRKLLTAMFGFAAIMTVWFGVMFVQSIEKADQANRIDLATRNLMVALLDAETGQRGYVLTGDDGYLAPYQAARRVIAVRLAELAKVVVDPRQQIIVKNMYEATQDKLAELQETVERRKKSFADAMKIVKSNSGKGFMDTLRLDIDTLQMHADDMYRSEQAKAVVLARIDFGLMVVTFLLPTLIFFTGQRKHV